MSGEIPALGNLAKPKKLLGLDENELSGKIPAELGKLENLEWLALYGNQLSGEFQEVGLALDNLRSPVDIYRASS